MNKYVSIGNKIVIKEFDKNNAPMGWLRIDILKNKLNNDLIFRNKFSKSELEFIRSDLE